MANNAKNNTYADHGLVRPLPDGPLDIVGDVHGEIDTLGALMNHLGYSPTGEHLGPPGPGGAGGGRRLVFVGDLVDRGPDSLEVVRLVGGLIASGRALAVMGNHDLNAVLGKQKAENGWFFGHKPGKNPERPVRNGDEREEILAILRGLPLALERADLRVVHAAWDDEAIETFRDEAVADIVEYYKEHVRRTEMLAEAVDDPAERTLIHQNHNPIKLITSGPEHRADKPFEAAGKLRYNARTPWWNRQGHGPMCVIGHYSRTEVQDHAKTAGLFSAAAPYAALGPHSNVVCVDYSVGYRHLERLAGVPRAQYASRLAALRWPERELVFDCGQRIALEAQPPGIPTRTLETSRHD